MNLFECLNGSEWILNQVESKLNQIESSGIKLNQVPNIMNNMNFNEVTVSRFQLLVNENMILKG